MTFNPNVPNAAQSPNLFPTQNHTNFGRLKTIISGDHVFNDSAAGTDGIHKQVTLVNRADPGSLPVGNGILYSKVSATSAQTELFFYNGLSSRQLAVSGFPLVLAAVNFNGTGGIGAKTIRSQFNVASVTKDATGTYTVNFGAALADNNYIVQITGKGAGTNGVSNGCVDGTLSYNAAVTTGLVKIRFNGSGSDLIDVEMGNVTIVKV